MNQQRNTQRGFTPLRVQRSFQRLDDGRGGRAAALAETLGFALEAAPVIADRGAEKAFQTGMRARIDGVKAENAASTNKSLLGFMFSKQARDGFDYQDAQLELPVLQAEELLVMEERLHNSRNPEDLAAYMAERDAILQERMADKSDIYRFTVAEALQETRAQQAKLFTSWVQSNRDKDRKAAAAAAAKAKAQARALEIQEAGNAAFDAIQGGDPKWFSTYVKEAEEKYGLTATEAKAIALEQAVAIADANNSPEILDDIDARFVSPEQRRALADARDTMFGERRAMQAIEADAAAADANAEADRLEVEAAQFETDLQLKLATGELTNAQAVAELFKNPFYRSNPDEREKAVNRIAKINTTFTDPAQEAIAIDVFNETLIESVLTGDDNQAVSAMQTALTQVRTPEKRAELAELFQQRKDFARDRLFEGLEPFKRNITQAFPSGVGDEITVADRLAGGGASNSFEPSIDTRVQNLMETHLIGLARDWYAQNPGVRMPYAVRRELQQLASEFAIEDGRAQFGTDQANGNGSVDDAVSRLEAIAK